MPKKFGSQSLDRVVVYPWVRLSKELILVEDPRRGNFTRSVEGRDSIRVREMSGTQALLPHAVVNWLLENGFAFAES